MKTNLVMIATFFVLDATFLSLMIGNFAKSVVIIKIGGSFGLSTSAFAFYLAAAQLLNEENFWFNLPVGNLRRSERVD